MQKLKVISIVFFLTYSLSAWSQENLLDKTITLQIDQNSIVEVLDKISEEYDVTFSYDPEIFSLDNRISFSFKDQALRKVLDQVLGKDFEYEVISNLIVLYKTKQSSANTQTIRGRIIDKDIKTPIIGASIIINQTNPIIGTITDAEGYYELAGVPVGRQSVNISFIGYKTVSINNLLLLSAKEMVLNVELEESIEQIEAVKISANNTKDAALNDMASVSARSFTIEETEKYAGSWGDPSRMASNFAGVVVAGDERNDIVIRGNSPSALIWQLEGVPIPSPNHFDNLGATGGPVSILNTNTLSRSDFFTGAFPVEYGNGYSGVFDLRMRNGNYNKYEFTGQLGFAGFELGAEGPLKITDKSSFLFNYRYSMLGLVDNFLWVGGLPHYNDFNYKINIPYTHGSVSVFGFGGSSYIEFSQTDTLEHSEGVMDITETDGSSTYFSGIKSTHFLNNKIQLTNTLAMSRRNPNSDMEYRMNDHILDKVLDYDDKQINYTYSIALLSKINSRNTIKIGTRVERTDISAFNYKNSIVDDSTVAVSIASKESLPLEQKNLYTINSFINYQHKFSERVISTTGIHFQNYLLNNTYSIEPRLGLKYKYSPKGRVSLAYGNHGQVQAPYNYFITDSTTHSINKDLDFTRSHQYVIGHDYSLNPNLRLKTEVYYQSLYNVPVLESEQSNSILNYGYSEDILWADSLVNEGSGENYGIDITFERFSSEGYYYLITASVFNSTYKGIDGIKRNTRYNGKYVLNALGGYEFRIGKNSLIDFNTRVVYAGGNWISPIDEEASIDYGFPVRSSSKTNSSQLNDYFRFDFRIGLVLQFQKFTHEIAFELTNLTNHRNETDMDYTVINDQIIANPRHQQGFFPMGLYRISF